MARSLLAWWPFAVTLLGVAALVGHPVPHSNEWTYLVLLKRSWNPEWLAGDWALAIPDHKHYVFNFLLGWPTCFLPIEVVAWIGRLSCWTGVLVFLFRIGDRLGIGRVATAAAILAWVVMGQSLVAYEWVLGGFEAKCIAYVLLFASLDGFLRGGRTWPAVALGLSFSLHPAVGLWGGLALGGAVALVWPNLRELARLAGIVLVLALPGALPILLVGGEPQTMADHVFQARVRMPFHLDPSWFDRGLVTAGVLMLAFNVRVAWLLRADRGWRLLGWMQVIAAAQFGFGITARLLGRWDWISLMPFRLFPLLVLLTFFWSLFHVIERRRELQLGTATILLGLLAVASLPNPLVAVQQRFSDTMASWARTEDDEAQAFRWIAANTPKDAVVVAAPEWDPSYLLVERPLVAIWSYRPVGHEAEWMERIESLCGDDWTLPEHVSFEEDMQRRFDARTREEVLASVERFGGDYLVGRADYDFPVVHRVGDFRVYALPNSGDDAAETEQHAFAGGPTTTSPAKANR